MIIMMAEHTYEDGQDGLALGDWVGYCNIILMVCRGAYRSNTNRRNKIHTLREGPSIDSFIPRGNGVNQFSSGNSMGCNYLCNVFSGLVLIDGGRVM